MGHQQQPGCIERKRGDLRQVGRVGEQRHAKANHRQASLVQRSHGQPGFQAYFERRPQRPAHRRGAADQEQRHAPPKRLRRSAQVQQHTQQQIDADVGADADQQRGRAAKPWDPGMCGKKPRQTCRARQGQQQYGAGTPSLRWRRTYCRKVAIQPRNRRRRHQGEGHDQADDGENGEAEIRRRDIPRCAGLLAGRQQQPASNAQSRQSQRKDENICRQHGQSHRRQRGREPGKPGGRRTRVGGSEHGTRDGSDEQQQKERCAEGIEREMHGATRRTDRQCQHRRLAAGQQRGEHKHDGQTGNAGSSQRRHTAWDNNRGDRQSEQRRDENREQHQNHGVTGAGVRLVHTRQDSSATRRRATACDPVADAPHRSPQGPRR